LIDELLDHINVKINVVQKKDYSTVAKRIRADEFVNGLKWAKNLIIKEQNARKFS